MQVVEASAATGQLVYTPDSETDALAIAPIPGYAVAIPTMDAIHGQESWRGEFVSAKYGDHSAWDVDTIVQMMREFFRAAAAVSLPDLAEYHWRLDKVCPVCDQLPHVCLCECVGCFTPAMPSHICQMMTRCWCCWPAFAVYQWRLVCVMHAQTVIPYACLLVKFACLTFQLHEPNCTVQKIFAAASLHPMSHGP